MSWGSTPINFKMLHTNLGELNQLYDTFCRVWAAGGQATLTTTSQGGKKTAKLELELGQPTVRVPAPRLLVINRFNFFWTRSPQKEDRSAIWENYEIIKQSFFTCTPYNLKKSLVLGEGELSPGSTADWLLWWLWRLRLGWWWWQLQTIIERH